MINKTSKHNSEPLLEALSYLSGRYILPSFQREEQLCFKARYYIGGEDYEDGEWCDFDKNYISDKYHIVYMIIAKHILATCKNQ